MSVTVVRAPCHLTSQHVAHQSWHASAAAQRRERGGADLSSIKPPPETLRVVVLPDGGHAIAYEVRHAICCWACRRWRSLPLTSGMNAFLELFLAQLAWRLVSSHVMTCSRVSMAARRF